jgi:hypothetical protein
MTDLRELLGRACDCLRDGQWVSEDRREDIRDCIKAIDAALARPPDAKPFCWICEDDERILHEEGSCEVYEQKQETKILAPYRQRPLYTAPQPPAGKGDAIPREIHERLVRDAKAQALREAAAFFEREVQEYAKWSSYTVAARIRQMASEHERGG